MRALLLTLGLVGCVVPTYDETHVDTLQIVALQSEPPELVPGTEVTLTVWVADPIRRGADVVLYSCTSLGAGCLEAADNELGPALPLDLWTATGPLIGSEMSVSFTIPAEAGAILEGAPSGAMPVFAVACSPGTCDLYDRIRANPPPGTAAYEDVTAMLADPTLWIDSVPRRTSSLAFKEVPLLQAPSSNANPQVNLSGSRAQLWTSPEEPVLQLPFRVTFDEGADQGWDARVYTTLGAIPAFHEAPGLLDVTLDPQFSLGTGEIFVVVEGDRGGTGVFTERVIVAPPSLPAPTDAAWDALESAR